MNKKLKFLLGALAIVIVGAVCVYMYINKSHPNYEKLNAEYNVSSKAIYDNFKSDSKASALKFNGKMIEINGQVSKIEASDTLVTVVFAFSQGLFGDEGIRCAMLPDYNQKTKLLKQGDKVDLKGLCQGFNETDVIFEKCSLTK
jgi:uncharacterized protein (DUF1330 family)